MLITGKTDVGLCRSQNEDGMQYGAFDDGTAWSIVCDGMGGVHGGQLASSMAIDFIGKKIQMCYNKNMSTFSFENLLLSTVTTANILIHDRAYCNEDIKGMGTTIVSAIVKNNVACIAHVGDSRVYKLTDTSVTQITKDHSLAQQMLDNGQITQEEFENFPRKNIITRALGVDETVEIDFSFVNLDENESLLLCTDGFSGLVSTDEMLSIYRESDFDSLCEKYINAANIKGGYDNITVVVMKG